MTPAAELGWIALRLRLERAAGYWLTCVGGGACMAGLLHGWLPLVIGDLIGIAVALAADRFRRITPRDVALHLDRALPELEESATLLLDPAPRAGLAALQAQRIQARWDPARVQAAIPRRELRHGLSRGLALSLAGLVLLQLVPPSGGPAPPGPAGDRSGTLAIQSLTTDITPPAYTRAARRRATGRDLEVEEGSRLRWEAELRGPVTAAWLAGSAGDSLPLVHDRGTRWWAEQPAVRSQLWRLRATGREAEHAQSADLRVAVRPDRPPTVTVLAPAEHTDLEPVAVAPLPVEVLAGDDYGVDSAALAVTIASGRGEAVRFRRLRLPFASRAPQPGRGVLLRLTLDLPGLGLGPGDELYFVAEVTDQRTPLPNRGRSGTHFVAVRDTAAAPTADLARMALGAQPEYFRSQRQIILDTERLLADSAAITRTAFRDRANDLGIDQGLLRLRYGQFLGEEFEQESSDVGEVHAHDDPENATLLGQSVKDKLRAAISAMWQAELQLRIGAPRAALPHEHRALEMIKQVQQDARVYVQRVGFEPAPIDVARIRLTGKLADLAELQRALTVPARESLPAIRAALPGLAAPAAPPVLPELLEAAGRELGALAVADPVHLAGVRDLRRYLDALAAGTACPECRARAERALYTALPQAVPVRRPEPPSRSAVGQRFQRLLRSPPP